MKNSIGSHASANNLLRITYVNTKWNTGGAAILAQRLANGMHKRSHNVHVLTGFLSEQDQSLFPINKFYAERALLNYCRRKGLLYYDIQCSHKLLSFQQVKNSDILHLHNLHGDYFNPFSLSGISAQKPVVWTLHDMQAITGHCACSLECQKWKTGCDSCADLNIYPKVNKDSTAQLWRDKKLIYQHSRLWIVTPAKWLANMLPASILNNHPVTCIPNGVDTEIFRPSDRRAARERLGLPQDAIIVGGSAGSLDTANPWKGASYVLEVVAELAARHKNFLFIAPSTTNISPLPPYIHPLPYTRDDARLSDYYAAADIFVYPSIADTMPLTLCEALSCGVPVVSFNTGGIPEIVRHCVDGYIVACKDSRGMVEMADYLLHHPDIREVMKIDARRGAVQRFEMDIMVHRYEFLYAEAITRFKKTRSPVDRFVATHVPLAIRTPAFAELEESKQAVH